MAEEAIEEEVMAEVVDSHMDSNMVEVVDTNTDSSMVEVVSSNMAEVVDSQQPVHHKDNQRKDKLKQPLGTLLTMSLTMSTKMKVILIRVHIATPNINSDWIIEIGASKHVTGNISEFDTYIQYPPTHRGTIQTADGTT